MASTVQTGGGSGVDLSELTSGELLFCSLLKTEYIRLVGSSSTADVSFGSNDWDWHYGKKYADMSKISQISFVASKYSGNGRMVWENESKRTQTDFSADSSSFSISAPSGDNSHCTFTISITDPSIRIALKVTSFTTTDGKVHTADNLNY